MGVDLRRGDIRVAEHRLDAAQVGAAVEEMRREGMAQDVRRDARRVDPRRERQLLQELPAALPGEPPAGAARREEPGRGPAVDEEGIAHRTVVEESLPRRRAERHDAFLVALAADEEEALV